MYNTTPVNTQEHIQYALCIQYTYMYMYPLLTRVAPTQSLHRSAHFLLGYALVLLLLGGSLESLPGQAAQVEVHQHVAQRLQVVTAALLCGTRDTGDIRVIHENTHSFPHTHTCTCRCICTVILKQQILVFSAHTHAYHRHYSQSAC